MTKIVVSWFLNHSSHRILIIVLCRGCFVVRQTSINWRALRFVFRDTTSSYESLLERGNFLPFSAYRIRCLGIETYKCFHGLNPDYLNKLFKQTSTKYNLRDSCRLEQPKFSTFSYGQRSFRYYGSKLWNLLPFSVKNTNDLNIFKTNITRWCYSKQCASFTWCVLKITFRGFLPFLYIKFVRMVGQRWFIFILSENCKFIYIAGFFFLDLIHEFIRLFFLSPCFQYWTAIYVHVYFLFPFRCSDVNLISILTI